MSESRAAFQLKSGVEDFAGGTVAVGVDGDSIDLGKELDDNGIIATDDPQKIAALEGVDVLKRIGISNAEEQGAEVPEKQEEDPAYDPGVDNRPKSVVEAELKEKGELPTSDESDSDDDEGDDESDEDDEDGEGDQTDPPAPGQQGLFGRGGGS